MPDTGDRFQSLQVINQDDYVPIPVTYKPGKYTLTQEKAGTRYVVLAIRTFADATSPADIKKVNAIQDQIKVEQMSKPASSRSPTGTRSPRIKPARCHPRNCRRR